MLLEFLAFIASNDFMAQLHFQEQSQLFNSLDIKHELVNCEWMTFLPCKLLVNGVS